MSRPHDGSRPSFFPFGNPFRMIFPKDTYLSQRNLDLLNSFEETLAKRLRNLKVKDKSEILRLSWMKLALESLCEIHTDIKTLITDLKFPVSVWDEKWMDVYLDSSVNLLDICIAFSSELTKLNQGQLLLQCVRHTLSGLSSLPSSEDLVRSRNSLDDWKQHISSKNKKLENCSGILHRLKDSLHLAKVKNSAKGKVLLRALCGVMVPTIFICGVFSAAFSGSPKSLIDLQVSGKFLWADAFNDLQVDVHTEFRSLLSNGRKPILKDLEAVELSVKKLYPLISGELVDPAVTETLKSSVMDLGKNAENLSQGVDDLSNEVENFFQIVLSGRDALLCNLRICNSNSKPQNNGGHRLL